jgi:hypothetical protein
VALAAEARHRLPSAAAIALEVMRRVMVPPALVDVNKARRFPAARARETTKRVSPDDNARRESDTF